MQVELQLPADLTELDQWVLWRMEARAGKPTKVPYSIRLKRASVTNPRDWADFGEADAVLEANRKQFESGGLGFVFYSADPFVGIDLDDCLEAGAVKPEFVGMVGRFSDTYMEISPSGSGIKVWARGKLPANVPGVRVIGGGSIELYDHSRYFAVTGRRFRGAPLEIEDHAADVLTLYTQLTCDPAASWPVQPLPSGRIPHGQQHSTLVSIAGTLRARRVCDEAILACLLAVNARQCEKPGPPANIERIVRSTRNWGLKAHGRGLDAPR